MSIISYFGRLAVRGLGLLCGLSAISGPSIAQSQPPSVELPSRPSPTKEELEHMNKVAKPAQRVRPSPTSAPPEPANTLPGPNGPVTFVPGSEGGPPPDIKEDMKPDIKKDQ